MSEKYLIVGATGSIGSSLATQLYQSGKEVHLVGRDENQTKSLSENQAFRLQSGNLILIKNKKENLLEIKGKNLMQLIWHIGNRHMPCQIEKDRIFIQYDEVIKKMILKLGGKVKKVLSPFKPEGGAYGIGRTHSHKH